MATKSFLNEEQHQLALKQFSAPRYSVNKSILRMKSEGPIDSQLGPGFSSWLGTRLRESFEVIPEWQTAEPILLGSWARNELCPKSDIDVLLAGDSKAAGEFARQINIQGLKIRYRMPADPNDWTVGVEPFDILALLDGQAVSLTGAERLWDQQERIRRRGRQFRRQLLQAILKERRERNRRYDSIANYLEPNLKYGPGGLRDIEQALSLMRLFPECAPQDPHALMVLKEVKTFLLAIRQRLHLLGGSDILAAAEQLDIARFFSHDGSEEFLSLLQASLGRAGFYAEVLVRRVQSPAKRLQSIDQLRFASAAESIAALHKDPDWLMQNQVRAQVDHLFDELSARKVRGVGELLESFFQIREPEAFFVALFQSRILEKALPDLARVKGLVQHDHYHRFTVDIHLLQAVRELKRTYTKPSRLGKLAPLVKGLGRKDWEALLWACLFHDLGKGTQQDHSTLGAKLVRKILGESWGFESQLVDEVAWLVENHLILSAAAFRRNPQSPSTWQFLAERGAQGERLSRLTLLTAIDIRATNPDAWTPWKERLLVDLHAAAFSPGAMSLMASLKLARSSRIKLDPLFLQSLDPFVLAAIPPKQLLEDFRRLAGGAGDLAPLWIKNKRGEIWVRFHSREDRPGLFFRFVQTLFALGCTIQQSGVKTMENFGVYDWFQVRTRKPLSQLKRRSELITEADLADTAVPKVSFERIELVTSDETETVLSFRGQDQRGLLLAAARTLFEEGFTIRWAKVHTWGQQIDDIFAVKTEPDLAKKLARLEQNLVKRA